MQSETVPLLVNEDRHEWDAYLALISFKSIKLILLWLKDLKNVDRMGSQLDCTIICALSNGISKT
ncbi:hypothetical protein AB1A81_13935 [Bdellovibrio bacteriovorus]|nr:hypothetical protein [Bdellovibrio bacteriovorus]AHZ83425.1 hypothetical protein EP01_00485 [Bdellovibrio bacteriovorus]BEV69394.1 hypothetical protein Bb109J_c2814 [Bdellovibrio bacteriovorus]